MAINWFPGHMHKARKEIKKVMPQMDLIIEVVDARIPFSSENPLVPSLRGDTPLIKVLNKRDLADPVITEQWLAWLERERGVRAVTLTHNQRQEALGILKLAEEMTPGHDRQKSALRVMILGIPNVGKSTLIKCLTGAYSRDEGTITLEGQTISPRSTLEAQDLGIGTVYQEVNLLANLTVAQNLTFGREPRRFGIIDGGAMRREAEAMIAGYGLDIDVNRDLGSYSVAVQQIVAIARAVALSGKVLILDEPTASLDAREVEMLFDVVRKLRDQGLGIIFVSHFLDQVFALTDRVTVLRNGCKITTEKTAELDRVRLISHMLGRELDESEADAQRRGTEGRVGSEPLIKVRDFGKRNFIEPFDLDIHRGEVVGLVMDLATRKSVKLELQAAG